MNKYKRKIIQLTTAILYNCNFFGFKNATIYQGAFKNICVPGLNCYSCPGAIAACPLGAFQSFLMQKKRGQLFFARIPFYIIGLLVLFGVLFGRIICGFLCPFGLIQELLYKIPTKKLKKNRITSMLSYIKYIVLILFVILVPFILYQSSFCKIICPAGTLEAGLFFAIFDKSIRGALSISFIVKVTAMLIILILSIFVYRTFCRFICPLGAFYSFFNKVSIFGLRIDQSKCTHCKACTNLCLMDTKEVSDRECIECGECIGRCKSGAISYNFMSSKI